MAGVPTRATRRFVRRLSDQCKLPVYAFVENASSEGADNSIPAEVAEEVKERIESGLFNDAVSIILMPKADIPETAIDEGTLRTMREEAAAELAKLFGKFNLDDNKANAMEWNGKPVLIDFGESY